MRFSHAPLRHSAAGAVLAVLACLVLPAVAQSTSKAAANAASTARKAAPIAVCDPEWPEAALAMPDRRATKLMLKVNAKGAVTSTKLIQSSNSASLDQATINAATSCQFHPAQKQGKPVASTVPFSYEWDQIVAVQQAPPAPAPAPTTAPKAEFASCAKPVWPKASLRNEETGTVTMEFLIAADGVVKEKRIRKSSGFRDLDNSAIEAIAKCRFQPATQSGQPIESFATLQYVWALE